MRKAKETLKEVRAAIEQFLEDIFLDKYSIGVFADLFIELGGVMLISIPGFFLAGEMAPIDKQHYHLYTSSI